MKTVASCAFALVLLGSLAGEVSAQSSCSARMSICASRCNANANNPKACVSHTCRPKLAECRQSGCWKEAAMFGGQEHCNLKKS